ncbi:LuxR C-terminal-related transcriptional regulator [Micromonospora sp. NPDC050417]|uniref:helix-turn-helix transcriptional regulator n=1 Tax=Micromonospora sp. NPDC050417 TaxID=3364280 RepID=UPI0037A62B8F
MLEFLGISAAVEAVYLAMVKHPDDGVSEIAERCRQSTQEVRRALDELVEMQLILPSREDSGRLRAVSPKVGLSALLRNQQLELQRQQQNLAIGSATVQMLITEAEARTNAAEAATVKRLTGMDLVQALLEDLSHHAEFECLSLMPGGGQSSASLEYSRPLDEDALHRGVALRTVYLDSARKDQATMAYARWMAEAGGEVRTVPVLSSRMVVVDRKIAVLPLNPANSRAGAIQIEEPGVVAALTAWFEEVWTFATPIVKDLGRDDRGLSSQERELLRLLGQGFTDEVVGRRLGVSLRTARRMMADLMSRLGAQSRFEAGVRAAQAGWVDASPTSSPATAQRTES